MAGLSGSPMQGAILAALKEKAIVSDLNVLDLSILIIFLSYPKIAHQVQIRVALQE